MAESRATHAGENAWPAASFWGGRKVFVTGHTGFKGSWLSLWLADLGADVLGYALEPPTTPNMFVQADVASGVRSTIADVRDFDRLARTVAGFRPDVVIHMAAQSVVKRGYESPIETYQTNVLGTVHLFEAVRRLGDGCAVINVTSDKCYAHDDHAAAFVEGDPMGGDDPYSSSKGCAELVTTAWRSSYFPPAELARHGVALASARAGNAIGGGDWTAHQLIPDLIRAFSVGEPCPIRSPTAVRPWQFVLEPLRGYLVLAERLALNGSSFASAWNFGPARDDSRPVAWIADQLRERWGAGAAWSFDSRTHPNEAPALRLDASRAARGLDWHPAVGLDEALDWVVEWYHGCRDGDVAAITGAQLKRYEQRVRGTNGLLPDALSC